MMQMLILMSVFIHLCILNMHSHLLCFDDGIYPLEEMSVSGL